jgi:hypothetical protein
LSLQTNEIIEASGLGPADRLAVRTAIAALEMLRGAAADCGCPIGNLDAARLIQWAAGKAAA